MPFIYTSTSIQELNLINKGVGQFLGLNLVSSKTARRLRCSVAVFVCWALIIAIGLIVIIVYVTLPVSMRLDIGLNETWYIRRVNWQAMSALREEYLNLPVINIIIGHAPGYYCNSRFHCTENMINLQQEHLWLSWKDIKPNFLVGGNGDVFEGRGANILGAMVKGYDQRSISIMFLGNYGVYPTDQLQFNHTQMLIDRLVEVGVLRTDYVLRGQCQVDSHTSSPGRNVMRELRFFTHWDAEDKYGCVPL